MAAWEGDDPLTVFDLLDYRRAASAEAARPARAHEAARYAELRRLKHFSRSNHVTHHVNKRTRHPDCPYCGTNLSARLDRHSSTVFA